MNLDPNHTTFIMQAGRTWIRDYAYIDCYFQILNHCRRWQYNKRDTLSNLSYNQYKTSDALLAEELIS